MIDQILQRLDVLRLELSAIDPAQDFDAADKVAGIASALRHTLLDAQASEAGAASLQERPARAAA